MLLSVIAAVALGAPASTGFQVDWKVTVIGKFSHKDADGREGVADLNHVYEGSAKLYGGAIGMIPATVDESSKLSQAQLIQMMQSTKVYHARSKSLGTIKYSISDKFSWTRVENLGKPVTEGYEGSLSGSGTSKPVDIVKFSQNSANNECRLSIDFQRLEGAPDLKNAFEEYAIIDGKKEIGVQQESMGIPANMNGQGLSPKEPKTFLGFIKSTGFVSMKRKVPALFKMYKGSGITIPVEVSIEAGVKKIAG